MVGAVALAVGLSGSILTFREEIERSLYEPRVEARPQTASLEHVLARATAIEPGEANLVDRLP